MWRRLVMIMILTFNFYFYFLHKCLLEWYRTVGVELFQILYVWTIILSSKKTHVEVNNQLSKACCHEKEIIKVIAKAYSPTTVGIAHCRLFLLYLHSQPFMCMHQFRCPWISIPTVVVVVSAVRVNLETLTQRVNFETEVDHDTMTEPTSDPDSLPKFQRNEQF